MAEVTKVKKPRITAASARSHTRRDAPKRGPGFSGAASRFLLKWVVVTYGCTFRFWAF